MSDDVVTKEQAIALAESGFWEDMTPIQIARFQMEVKRLCMPFDVFHGAVEAALGRPVWTHEFGMNADGIRAELRGEADPPSMQDIIDMIPADKRIIVATDD